MLQISMLKSSVIYLVRWRVSLKLFTPSLVLSVSVYWNRCLLYCIFCSPQSVGQLADGSTVIGEDGKPLIHTDGTGYISEDLAREFPGKIFKANMVQDHNFEVFYSSFSSLNIVVYMAKKILVSHTSQYF